MVGMIPFPKLVNGACTIWNTKSCILPHGVNVNTILTIKNMVNVNIAGMSAANDFDTAGGTLAGILITKFFFTNLQ